MSEPVELHELSHPTALEIERVQSALAKTRSATAFFRAVASIFRNEFEDIEGSTLIEHFAEDFWCHERNNL
jgi:hypothetical protein